jgi:hypothetical protein
MRIEIKVKPAQQVQMYVVIYRSLPHLREDKFGDNGGGGWELLVGSWWLQEKSLHDD